MLNCCGGEHDTKDSMLMSEFRTFDAKQSIFRPKW